ncbi:hypothetical protein E1B28_001101 [Marasmius oreades]|uniref:Anaphase-promoting complex subunit 4 n=1 Tax=Marasmius oreades TaxID=181124 RepID=A0A9P8AF21_9AGAR|nr:uncharacterized protein E1B28_001101 [Marasmius oreades]KAG7099237.1 hypothetical protein E1B28_001101 [Marasmius oreades]
MFSKAFQCISPRLGQSIAVAHDPPSITIHSIQDGHEERSLRIECLVREDFKLTGVWWRSQEKSVQISPDIFRRNNVITGSAHSILRTLPLLDGLQDDSHQISATDLFAFQGTQTHTSRPSVIPDVMRSWPTLQTDPFTASINVSSSTRTAEDGVVDEVDETNVNSLLTAAGSNGDIHFFLDGAYPIGAVVLGAKTSITTLFKDPKLPVIYVHPQVSVAAKNLTDLRPTIIHLPLLEQRDVRDFAKLSTTARELAWYIMRVINEMRSAWMGSETSSGARELGPRWLRALVTKQREQFGQENPQPVLNLTTLLVTGRASEALSDFLGSGEQMSERGIQKWESTVTEALVKIRDYSEKRLSPACQYLYVVLEEVSGWSKLPTLFSSFQIPGEIVEQSLILLKRGIILSNWLAATARRELNRFKEFISWLRFEIAAANPSNETPPPIQHDILEVNQYLMSGLESSSIDKWFIGVVPSFSLQELGIPSQDLLLSSTLQYARQTLAQPDQLVWHMNTDPAEVTEMDRNLHALVEDLISKCRLLFDRSTGAATRAATVSYGSGSAIGKENMSSPTLPDNRNCRERVVFNQSKGDFQQYFAVHTPYSENRAFLCLLRHRYEDSGPTFRVDVALLQCCTVQDDEASINMEILAFEFFDDHCMIILYRLPPDGGTFIGTVHYDDLEYQELRWEFHVTLLVREELMECALRRLEAGELALTPIPIKRCRALDGYRTGTVQLAVNGRVGRRIACVLDNKGTTLETFDMEDDEITEESMDGERE